MRWGAGAGGAPGWLAALLSALLGRARFALRDPEIPLVFAIDLVCCTLACWLHVGQSKLPHATSTCLVSLTHLLDSITVRKISRQAAGVNKYHCICAGQVASANCVN